MLYYSNPFFTLSVNTTFVLPIRLWLTNLILCWYTGLYWSLFKNIPGSSLERRTSAFRPLYPGIDILNNNGYFEPQNLFIVQVLHDCVKPSNLSVKFKNFVFIVLIVSYWLTYRCAWRFICEWTFLKLCRWKRRIWMLMRQRTFLLWPQDHRFPSICHYHSTNFTLKDKRPYFYIFLTSFSESCSNENLNYHILTSVVAEVEDCKVSNCLYITTTSVEVIPILTIVNWMSLFITMAFGGHFISLDNNINRRRYLGRYLHRNWYLNCSTAVRQSLGRH